MRYHFASGQAAELGTLGDEDRLLKSALTTAFVALLAGFATFWLQYDVIRNHASYATYLQVNALYLEATDFGFARDPLFWLVLASSTVLVFGVAGNLGFRVGRSVRGVVLGSLAPVLVHLLVRYFPRLPEATWEYHIAFLAEAGVAVASAAAGAHLVNRSRKMATV